MTELVTRNYWWLEIIKDIGKYVNVCDLCQRMMNRTKTQVGKLTMNEILEKLEIYLIVNFIMKLPLVAEKNTILVVCDQLSKIAHFVAMTEETSAKRLAWLF